MGIEEKNFQKDIITHIFVTDQKKFKRIFHYPGSLRQFKNAVQLCIPPGYWCQPMADRGFILKLDGRISMILEPKFLKETLFYL